MLYFFNVRTLDRESQELSVRVGLFFTKFCCSFFVLLTRNAREVLRRENYSTWVKFRKDLLRKLNKSRRERIPFSRCIPLQFGEFLLLLRFDFLAVLMFLPHSLFLCGGNLDWIAIVVEKFSCKVLPRNFTKKFTEPTAKSGSFQHCERDLNHSSANHQQGARCGYHSEIERKKHRLLFLSTSISRWSIEYTIIGGIGNFRSNIGSGSPCILSNRSSTASLTLSERRESEPPRRSELWTTVTVTTSSLELASSFLVSFFPPVERRPGCKKSWMTGTSLLRYWDRTGLVRLPGETAKFVFSDSMLIKGVLATPFKLEWRCSCSCALSSW